MPGRSRAQRHADRAPHPRSTRRRRGWRLLTAEINEMSMAQSLMETASVKYEARIQNPSFNMRGCGLRDNRGCTCDGARMTAIERLLTCEGQWRGTNRLQVSEADPPDDSPSTAIVTPVLNGRFVRIDQTWAWREKPQAGSFLIGFQEESRTVTTHWIDSWHMGAKVMACQGLARPDGVLDLRGTYAAPPGPDWGWRIMINAATAGRLEITMFNVEPDGTEQFAVRATYSRA